MREISLHHQALLRLQAALSPANGGRTPSVAKKSVALPGSSTAVQLVSRAIAGAILAEVDTLCCVVLATSNVAAACVALFALAACQVASIDAAPKVLSPALRLADGGGLQHVAQLAPQILRGAQPTDAGYQRLKLMGVKTVISFRCFTDTREAVEAAGLRYLRIPIYASIGSSPPTDEQLQLFFATVLDPEQWPVYMHCKHGKDRTGMMAALLRIERHGFSNAAAIAEMQEFGYHDVFRDLIGFVRDYQPRGFEPPTRSQ